MESSKSFEKIKKKLKIAKRPKIVPKIFQTCFEHVFVDIFPQKKLPRVPWRVGPSEILKKNQKNFKNPKVPKIVSKSVQTCFDYALGQFFSIFFAQCTMQGFSDFLDLRIWVQFSETLLNRHSFCIHATVNVRNPNSDFLDLKFWVQISEPKNLRSIFRHKNQQTFFLHSRHSQYTRSHFRFSGPKIMSSDSRTEKFEISFPTQKSTDILIVLTPQWIYAIPFQVFWTYIHEFRFRNLKTWDQFSWLKFWGRDLEKIQGKNQKNSKF